MKTQKKYILLLTIGLTTVLISCKKFLETSPTDFNVAANYYKTPQQLNYALAGIYAWIRNTPLAINLLTEASVPSDESYFVTATQLGPATFNSDAQSSIPQSVWSGCYTAINYCNTMLDNLGNASDLDENTVSAARGEAIFLRSYFFFMLVQLYGDIPMPLKASSSVNDGILPRVPAADAYDKIISDMTIAEGLLKNQTSKTFTYTERVTQDAVQGMLARVCLYAAGNPVKDTKRYAEALKWASKLVNGGQHSLNPDFRQVFINLIQDKYDTRESIWEAGFNYFSPTSTVNLPGPLGVNNGISQGNSTQLGLDTGYAFGYVRPHPRLYKAYSNSSNQFNGDVRRDWTIANFGYSLNTTAPFNAIWKSPFSPSQLWERFPGKFRREYEAQISRSNSRTGTPTNQPLLRYADVLLMLAEAENEVNGPTSTAYDAINAVRRRSIPDYRTLDELTVTNVGAGYVTIPQITVSGGGGSGAAFEVALNPANRSLAIVMRNQGKNYSSLPTLIIPSPVTASALPWAAGKPYAVGDQVTNAGRTYTVTIAGTSTSAAPTVTSGSTTAASTGAVFTLTVQAVATVTISAASSQVDLQPGLSKEAFRKAIQDERFRELAYEGFRQPDLKRWGILVTTVKDMANDINGLSVSKGIPAAPSGQVPAALAPVNNITARDIFWPIPARDIAYNPLLKQNPGF